MKGVELYGQVRRAVYVEGLSRRRGFKSLLLHHPVTLFLEMS